MKKQAGISKGARVMMAAEAEALARAVAAGSNGNLSVAERIARGILINNPEQVGCAAALAPCRWGKSDRARRSRRSRKLRACAPTPNSRPT